MSKDVYNDKVRADMEARYLAAETEGARKLIVSAIAAELKQTVPSVRAVMVRAGFYISKEYKNKQGDKPESKEVIVESIAKLAGCSAEQLPGLEKANKTSLILLRTVIQTAADIVSEDDETAAEDEPVVEVATT